MLHNYTTAQLQHMYINSIAAAKLNNSKRITKLSVHTLKVLAKQYFIQLVNYTF